MQCYVFLLVGLTLMLSLFGCRESGTRQPLTTADLEREVGGVLALNNLTLTDQGEGRLVGTGTKTTGEVYQVKVDRISVNGFRADSVCLLPDGRGTLKASVTRPAN